MRAIACMMVFFSHAMAIFVNTDPKTPFLGVFSVVYDGSLAVKVFWIISGYFTGKNYNFFSIREYYLFCKKKIIRIYPMMLCSIIMGTFFCNLNINYDVNLITEYGSRFWQNKIDIGHVLKTCLLIDDFNIINPPLWTMLFEVEMIFILPWYISICKNEKMNVQNKIVLMVILFCGYSYIFRDCIVLLTYLGGAAYALVEEKLVKYKKNIVLYLLISIELILWLFMYTMNKSVKKIEILSSIEILLIFIITHSLKNVRFFLSKKALTFIGNISYEIYLLHFIVLLVGRHYANKNGNQFLLIIFLLIVSVAIGVLMHKTDEFIRKKLRL